MAYINLSNESGYLGQFTLPESVSADGGQIFTLGVAVKTGGNGVVFEARNTRASDNSSGTDQRAVKFLKQLDQQRVDRFENEVRVLRELSCPYISAYFADGRVSLLGIGKATHSVPWVAIQLGGSNMRQHVEDNGPLSIAQLKDITHGMCEALKHLHQAGFIHRDIKPENFVWRSPTSTAPMMIDFGIAKRQGEDVSMRPMDNFTRVTEFVGPVFFSSPELIEYSKNKASPVDYRSDIFQLGKVLWYLATGKVSAGIPSKKDSPSGGATLRDVVIEMIDDDPDARIQSLDEIRQRVLAI